MNEIIFKGDVIGTVQNIDFMLRNNKKIDGHVSFIHFSNKFLDDVFSNGVLHQSSQKAPFDVQINTGRISNIWLKSYSRSYKMQDFSILEKVEFEAESFC